MTTITITGDNLTINGQPASAAPVSTDPTREWKSGTTTLDPLTMAMTLGLIGKGGVGTTAAIRDYHRWYHETYGWQCSTAGAPHNAEDRSRCEFADIATAVDAKKVAGLFG